MKMEDTLKTGVLGRCPLNIPNSASSYPCEGWNLFRVQFREWILTILVEYIWLYL